MLEYVFFDSRPRDQFISQLNELGIDVEYKDKGEELLVLIQDDLSDSTVDRIEGFFVDTLPLSEALMAEAEGVDSFDVAAVEVKLKSGELVMASVDSNSLAKVLSVLDFDELSGFVDAITQAVETPDFRPICKR